MITGFLLRIEKARKNSKLIPKKVQVMRNGKQFTMTVYVDPTEKDSGPAQGGLFDPDSPETFKKDKKKKKHNKTWTESIMGHIKEEGEVMPASMRNDSGEYQKKLSTRERAYEEASKGGITFREKNIAMDFIGLDIEKIMSSIDRADDPEATARFALDYAEKLGNAVPPGTMKQLREKLNAMKAAKDVKKENHGVSREQLEITANVLYSNGVISFERKSVDFLRVKEMMKELENYGVLNRKMKAEMAKNYLKKLIKSIDAYTKNNKGRMTRDDRYARKEFEEQLEAIEQGGPPIESSVRGGFMDGVSYLSGRRSSQKGYQFEDDSAKQQAEKITKMLFQHGLRDK